MQFAPEVQSRVWDVAYTPALQPAPEIVNAWPAGFELIVIETAADDQGVRRRVSTIKRGIELRVDTWTRPR